MDACKATPGPLYPREADPVSIAQKAGLAPWPVWTGAESFVPTGFRSSDRLHYPDPLVCMCVCLHYGKKEDIEI
jgi:hypothetical protein